MKKVTYCFWLLLVGGLVLSFLKHEAPVLLETHSPLESRLNKLLGKMSMQEKIEQLYYQTDSNARLRIQQFKGSDGPHGIGNRAPGFSSFPVTIAMAATWDPPLITRIGRAI